MTVYVDALQACIPNARWRWSESCHMFAEDLDELHAFAKRLGMRQSWFQKPGTWLPHYDLTRGRREKAVRLGAVEAGRDVHREFLKRFDARERPSGEKTGGPAS